MRRDGCPCAVWIAATTTVLTAASGATAGTATTDVRTNDGAEFATAAMAYRPSGLVLALTDGRQCSLGLTEIDWEASARHNGGAVDLLRLLSTAFHNYGDVLGRRGAPLARRDDRE